MGKGQKGDVFGGGNTQGDPLGTAMFAIAFRPLIDHTAPAGATQVWFADYVAVGGTFLKIRNWWDAILELGPSFGYHITVISVSIPSHPSRPVKLCGSRAFLTDFHIFLRFGRF